MKWVLLRWHDYIWHFVSLLLTSSKLTQSIRNSDLPPRTIPLFKLESVALGWPVQTIGTQNYFARRSLWARIIRGRDGFDSIVAPRVPQNSFATEST